MGCLYRAKRHLPIDNLRFEIAATVFALWATPSQERQGIGPIEINKGGRIELCIGISITALNGFAGCLNRVAEDPIFRFFEFLAVFHDLSVSC